MKTSDLWSMLILSAMPEKPLELEGMWKTCENFGTNESIEYIASFKKDELVEDYFGLVADNGSCGGKRIFHFRRAWSLKFNNFNFLTEHKNSSYIFQPKEGPPNWYGCCHFRADDSKRAEICRIHEMPGDHELEVKNEYTYLIKGETLQTNFKGDRKFLKRVEYPTLMKFKNYLIDFYYSKNPSDEY